MQVDDSTVYEKSVAKKIILAVNVLKFSYLALYFIGQCLDSSFANK